MCRRQETRGFRARHKARAQVQSSIAQERTKVDVFYLNATMMRLTQKLVTRGACSIGQPTDWYRCHPSPQKKNWASAYTSDNRRREPKSPVTSGDARFASPVQSFPPFFRFLVLFGCFFCLFLCCHFSLLTGSCTHAWLYARRHGIQKKSTRRWTSETQTYRRAHFCTFSVHFFTGKGVDFRRCSLLFVRFFKMAFWIEHRNLMRIQWKTRFPNNRPEGTASSDFPCLGRRSQLCHLSCSGRFRVSRASYELIAYMVIKMFACFFGQVPKAGIHVHIEPTKGTY